MSNSKQPYMVNIWTGGKYHLVPYAPVGWARPTEQEIKETLTPTQRHEAVDRGRIDKRG